MAIDLSLMTAKPREAAVNGHTLTVAPLVLSDFAYMQDWFMEQPLEDIAPMIEKLGDHITPDKKADIVSSAQKEYETRRKVIKNLEGDKNVIKRVSDDMRIAFQSFEGTARMLWLSVKKYDDSLSLEDVRDMMDIETLQAIQELLDSISFEEKDSDHDKKYVDYDPEKKTAV